MCVRLLLTVRSHSFVISALPQFSTSDSGSIFRGRIPSTEKAITISVLGKRSLMLSIMPWRKFFSTALNLVVMKKLNTCKYGKIAYGPNGPNWGWYNGPFWNPIWLILGEDNNWHSLYSYSQTSLIHMNLKWFIFYCYNYVKRKYLTECHCLLTLILPQNLSKWRQFTS